MPRAEGMGLDTAVGLCHTPGRLQCNHEQEGEMTQEPKRPYAVDIFVTGKYN